MLINFAIGALVLFILVMVVFFTPPQKLSMPFVARECTGHAWKRKFPDAEAQTIREFLYLLTESMGFERKDKLKFLPEDQLFEIYRSIYTSKYILVDAFECERFLKVLSDKFGKAEDALFDACNSSSNITLGDLFQLVAKRG